MSLDQNTSIILLIILGIAGAAVLVADGVIFIRWIAYLWEKYRVEEAEAQYERAAAPYAAPESSQPAYQYGEAAVETLATPDAPGINEAIPPLPRPSPPEYPFARTWSLVDPWLAFQFVFIVSQIVITLALLPLILRPVNGGMSGIMTAPGIIIQSIGLFFMNGLFVAATAFYLKRYGSSLPEIGLGRVNSRLVITGIGLGLILFVAATGGEILLDKLLPHVLPKPVMDALVKLTKELTAGGMFDNIKSIPIKVFFALAGAIAAPIGEEVFFRGFLYNAFKRRLNVPAGIILSGLCFALIHIGPLAILVIFPMGMALAYVYEKTKSLWVTICMHATHNGITFALALFFPHLGDAPAQPVKPVTPPSKPAIVANEPARLRRSTSPPYQGVRTHA